MTELRELSCEEAEPLLPLVADGALGPDDDPALFAHLARCASCQRAVAQHDLIALAIARGAAASAARRSWWRRPWLAAAAGLALASGLLLALSAPRGASPLTPPSAAPAVVAESAAGAAPEPVASPAAAEASAAATPLVIAVPRPDGCTLYLVRQGGRWSVVSLEHLDGAVEVGGASAGLPVRY